MFKGGISKIGSAMTIGQGVLKRSNTGGKSFAKGSDGEYCLYCKRFEHTKETWFKLHGKDTFLKCTRGNKGTSQKWVDNTTLGDEETN